MADKIMMPALTPKDLYERDDENRKYIESKKIYWPNAKDEQEHDEQALMQNKRLSRGIGKPDQNREKAIDNDEWFKTPYYRERLKHKQVYAPTEREEADSRRKSLEKEREYYKKMWHPEGGDLTEREMREMAILDMFGRKLDD